MKKTISIFMLVVVFVFTSAVIGADTTAQKTASEVVLHVGWGSGEGQVGLLKEPETENVGPLAFSVRGNEILLLDSVNQRVLKSESGSTVRTVAKGVKGWTIASDGGDGFFVADRGTVNYYSGKSDTHLKFPISSKLKIIEGYGSEISLVNGVGVFYDNVDQKSVMVAAGSAEKGFKTAKGVEYPVSKSVLKNGGKNLRYRVKRLSSKDIRILGEDDGGKILLSVPVQVKDGQAGAVLFKGVDGKGNIYVELERLEGNRVNLEVHRYAPSGKCLSVIELFNDYVTTVYKKTEVTTDGSVYQMMTTPEGVTIVRYGEEVSQ